MLTRAYITITSNCKHFIYVNALTHQSSFDDMQAKSLSNGCYLAILQTVELMMRNGYNARQFAGVCARALFHRKQKYTHHSILM